MWTRYLLTSAAAGTFMWVTFVTLKVIERLG